MQQGYAPTQIGEAEDADAQLDEVMTRKPRRNERAPSQKDRAPETQRRQVGKGDPQLHKGREA